MVLEYMVGYKHASVYILELKIKRYTRVIFIVLTHHVNRDSIDNQAHQARAKVF